MTKNKYEYRELKTLWWGPKPWEKDGGAVVEYYQLRKMAELRPRWDWWGIPKVPEELVTRELPFMKFLIPENIERDLPYLMNKEQIPLLTTFHIAEYVEKVMDAVHDVGGKILQWQTVHWKTDRVFSCKRLNELDAFIAPTKFAKKMLIQQGGIDNEKIAIIPHGVDTAKFFPHKTALRLNYGINDNDPVILYSGRLSLWKGVHNIIPIIRGLVRDFNAYFIIRGGYFGDDKIGKKLDYLLSTIASRNKNVIYLPQWVSPQFMEELFATSDIVLFPSGHEGFGCPIVEGMACGRPVVTTDMANTREILGTKAGILIQPTEQVGICDDVTPIKVPSSDAIDGALRFLIQNRAEREIMGMFGLERAKKYFDLTLVSKLWFKVIDHLIPLDYSMDTKSKERLLNI